MTPLGGDPYSWPGMPRARSAAETWEQVTRLRRRAARADARTTRWEQQRLDWWFGGQLWRADLAQRLTTRANHRAEASRNEAERLTTIARTMPAPWGN